MHMLMVSKGSAFVDGIDRKCICSRWVLLDGPWYFVSKNHDVPSEKQRDSFLTLIDSVFRIVF